jgi:hypothetical protein
MAIGDVPSGYWHGLAAYNNAYAIRAHKISKTAWMDLYYDLFQQCFGESETSLESVVLDAEKRLKLLKQNGIR